ncbi:MAG: hypothetical protein ACRC1W_12240 [Shewanella sp.]
MNKQNKKVPAKKMAKEKDVSKAKMMPKKAADMQAGMKRGMKVAKKIKC